MTKLLLLAALAAALAPAARSQTVSGTVTDSTGLTLPGATVLLSGRGDGVMAAFARVDTSGAFRLPAVAPGAYELRISFVGFEPLTQAVEVATSPIDLGRFVLRQRLSELGQLEVTGRRVPVVVRGDTLVYEASAFEVRAGSSVQTLLEEMPGVEVDADGTVRAQGRVVDRVTVDGRDFFGDAPSVATRNLPADAVQRVQIFDDRPDGEDSGGGRRTINLELREDRRQSTFGRAEGGGGADMADPASARYAGRASVNRFGSSLRLSGIASANNVNEPGMTGREYLGLVGTGDAQSGDIIRVDSPVLQEADDVRGFASSWTGGANLTYDAGRGTTAQASYVGYAARTERERETVRERLADGGGTAVETETAVGASTAWVHRVEARADRTFGDGHTLRVVTTLDAQGGDGDSDVARRLDAGALGFDATTSYRTASDYAGARLGATYNRPLGDLWRVRAEVGTTLILRDEDARSDCSACADAPFPDGVPVRRTVQGVTASAAATRSLGGVRSIELRAEQALDIQTQTLRDDGLGALAPSSYRRPFATTAVGAVLSGGTAALRASVGADLSVARRGDGWADGGVRVLPTASLRYAVARNRTVRLNYDARWTPTSVFKLHAVPTLLSPFRVHLGNPDLQDPTAHTVTAQYLDVNTFRGSSLFAYVYARYGRDAQGYARTVDAVGVTTVVPVNVGDALNLSASASYERPVGESGLTARATLSGSRSSAREVVNGLNSAYQASQGTADVRLRKRGGALRRSEVGLRASVQSLAYDRGVGLSRTEARLNPYARLSVAGGWGAVQVSLEQDVRLGSFGYPARAPLVDVEVSLPPVGRVNASVTASDLLNGGVLIEQDLTPGFAEVNRYETLGRRVVFRLTTAF